jgi:hypothetical protein
MKWKASLSSPSPHFSPQHWAFDIRHFLCLFVPLCLCAFAACGCVGPAEYLKDRALDAVDPFRANVSVGPGLHGNVNATRFVALGAGRCRATRVGIRRGQWGAWNETRWDLNLLVPVLGDTRIHKAYFGQIDPSTNRDTLGVMEAFPPAVGDRTRGAFEVSANLHVIYLGAEAGLDLGELADFVLGWLGVDIANDDERDPFRSVHSPIEAMRQRAVRQLAFRKGDAATDALVGALGDPSPLVRFHALRGLMERNQPRTLPAVAAVLDDPDLVVRTQAVVTMSHIAGVPFVDQDPVGKARSWWEKTGKAKYGGAKAK